MSAYVAFWLYLILLFAAAWVGGYSRRLRETAAMMHDKLAAELPSGVDVPVRTPWYARGAWLEIVLVVAALCLALVTLDWVWATLGFALFLGLFMPLVPRTLMPASDSFRYRNILRRDLYARMQRSQDKGDRAAAEVLRQAVERIDKGL